MFRLFQKIVNTVRQVKRVIVITVGFTVLLIGIALLVLPGPAFIVIPIGLGILATELVWARKLLDKLEAPLRRMREKARNAKSRKE